MADFCKQCSENIFGEDFREMAGISQEEHTKNQLYANVLCEGCGPIQVDHEGACVNDDCIEKGHKDKIKCPVVEKYEQLKALQELTEITEEMGGYDAERAWAEFEADPAPLAFDDDPFEDYQGDEEDENS